MDQFVSYYNTERLRSAIGYVTPQDKLHRREQIVFAERARKLAQARKKRARHHHQASVESAVRHASIPTHAAVTSAA